MFKEYKIISIFIVALTFGSASCSIFIEEVNWKSFFSGLTGGFITMFISLIFFNMYLNEKEISINKSNATRLRNKNLELISSVYQNLFNEFYIHTKQMLNGNLTENLIEITEGFKFEKLANIFDKNLIRKHGFSKSNIEVFFSNLNKLKDGINFILYNGNFEENEDIKQYLIDYLNYLSMYNIENSIYEVERIINSNVNLKTGFLDYIKDEDNRMSPKKDLLYFTVSFLPEIIEKTIKLNDFINLKMKTLKY